MPVVVMGSAVVSTQRQQVEIDAGIVRNKHRDEEITGKGEGDFVTGFYCVVLQPLERRLKIGIAINGVVKGAGEEIAVGLLLKFSYGIAGLNNDELSHVGQNLFCRQPKLSYSVGDDVADPGVGQADHVAGVSDDKHGVIPFDWT